MQQSQNKLRRRAKVRINLMTRRKSILRKGLVGTFIVMLLLLMSQGQASAQAGKLYPVDEASQDPSFKAFRARLLKAVEKRDAKHLRSILHPRIKNSFGAGGGVRDFTTQWKPERSDSNVWKILSSVLSLGGTFTAQDGTKEFCAPYVFTKFPEQLDAFRYRVVIGTGVSVRAQPTESAPVIAVLSHDIVEASDISDDTNENERRGDWVKVVLANNKEGYISGNLVRSPVDYRACFKKVGHTWLMTILLAGD